MIKTEVKINDGRMIGKIEVDGDEKTILTEMVNMTGKLILEVMGRACPQGKENKFVMCTLKEIEDYVMESEKMQRINKVRDEEMNKMLKEALKRFFESKEDK